MKDNNDFITIDLKDIMRAMWAYKWLIALIVILAVTVTVVNLRYFTPDTYTASGIIYVSGKNSRNTDDDVVKSDIDAARTLSTTYIETLKIRSFLMGVSDEIEGKYSWEEIKHMMSISAVNETELLAVKVTANSDQDAYELADAILKLAPKKLEEVTEGGSIRIVDEVLLPDKANDKGAIRMLLVSIVIGVVLAGALIFFVTFFDTKVHRGEDVEKRYQVSILGNLNN